MNVVWLCGLVGLLLNAQCVFAQPAIEGIVEPTTFGLESIALERVGVVWHKEVRTDTESTFFRLHFTDISASPGTEFLIRIRDRANQILLELRSSELSEEREYWTSYLAGTYALVEIENLRAALDKHVSLKLAEIATERQGARVLSIQDKNNPKDLPIAYYSNNVGLTEAARSVAKLRFEKDKVLKSCTDFLVGPDLLLTNQHCFDTAAACKTAIAQFGYQEDRDHNLSQGKDYRCEAVKDSDSGLDFTIIKLKGNPGSR